MNMMNTGRFSADNPLFSVLKTQATFGCRWSFVLTRA